MIEWGEVKDIKRKKAQILLNSLSSMCKNCNLCNFGKKRILQIENERELRKGDRVKILMPEGKSSYISFLTFGLPALILAGGAILSGKIFSGEEKQVLFTIGIFLGGLAISQVFSRLLMRKFLQNIKILEIVRK